jgi:hypothetical protein
MLLEFVKTVICLFLLLRKYICGVHYQTDLHLTPKWDMKFDLNRFELIPSVIIL